jgi:hypothetical protein
MNYNGKLIEKFLLHFPIKLNKPPRNYPDMNLTCFIPIERIIKKPIILSKFRKMLDLFVSLHTNEDSFSELFESKLSNRLMYDISLINQNDHVKTKITIPDLKRTMFNVNLYNINNYSLAGINPDRRVPKNLKAIQYSRDIQLSNNK